MRPWLIAVMVVVLTAGGTLCTDGSDGRRSADGRNQTVSRSGAMVGRLSKTDLAVFAPLPAKLTAVANQPTDEQVALGRMLFYETRLSAAHNISCNSCHPLNGYGADGRALSFGDHGQLGGRNSPSVYNAAGQIAQFWDGRSSTVEDQAKGPILNPAEMNMPNSASVLAQLRASPEYRAAFKAAFPRDADPVTYDNLGRAIGAFERGLLTPARWDRFLKGDTAALTPIEDQGVKTFVTVGCSGCHNGAFVGGNGYQKLGMKSAWPVRADSGRYKVTHDIADLFVFKVPSLRNVQMTSPYFHDGSVTSLEHSIRLMGRHQLGVELTDTQVRDVGTWMGSLTGEIPVEYIAQPQLPRQ